MLPAFSKQLLQDIQRLTLQARKLATSHLSGYYRSALKGTGMTFDKVREYIPGDDIRHIDWHVTARMSAPYIKEFREERHVMLMLLMDNSASMALGPPEQASMYRLGCEMATLLATAACLSGDAVGLMICGHEIAALLPPLKHTQRAHQIATHLLLTEPKSQATNLNLAAPHLASLLPRRSNVVLISDGGALVSSNQLLLQHLASKHHMLWIQPTSLLHERLPNAGLARLGDSEQPTSQVLLDSQLEQVRRLYQQTMAQQQASLLERCQQYGITHLPLYVEQDMAKQCLQFLRGQGQGAFR